MRSGSVSLIGVFACLVSLGAFMFTIFCEKSGKFSRYTVSFVSISESYGISYDAQVNFCA